MGCVSCLHGKLTLSAFNTLSVIQVLVDCLILYVYCSVIVPQIFVALLHLLAAMLCLLCIARITLRVIIKSRATKNNHIVKMIDQLCAFFRLQLSVWPRHRPPLPGVNCSMLYHSAIDYCVAHTISNCFGCVGLGSMVWRCPVALVLMGAF